MLGACLKIMAVIWFGRLNPSLLVKVFFHHSASLFWLDERDARRKNTGAVFPGNLLRISPSLSKSFYYIKELNDLSKDYFATVLLALTQIQIKKCRGVIPRQQKLGITLGLTKPP